MSQTLMVRFGADTSAAKRAVVELASTVAQNALTMATAVRGNVQSIEGYATVLQRLPAIAKGAIAALVAFEAVKFAFNSVADAIERTEQQLAALVKVGSQAQGAGVGSGFLQQWLDQAKALNLETSSMEGMLKRAREASTVRQGTGKEAPASEMAGRLALQAKAGNVGPDTVGQFNALDGQEARIRFVLDLVQQLLNEGRQLAALDIAGKMFGSDFEEKLRSGVDMVGRMKSAIDGAPVGFSQEQVERAQQITRTLDEASRIMSDALRPLNEDMARWSQQQAQSWADMKVSMAEAVSYMMQIYKLATSIGDAFSKWGSSDFWKNTVEWMKNKGLVDTGTTIPGIDNGFEKAGPEKPAEGSPLTLKIAPKRDRSANLPAAKSSGAATSEQDPVDSFINGIEKQTAALKAEIDAYTKSNAEKRVAIDLAKAEEIAKQNGTKVTEEQAARIREASAAAAQHKDKLHDLDQAQRQAAESARYFGDALSDSLGDAIFDGAKLTDIVRNLSSQLGRGGLQALMTGTGPLAGFLGTAPKASAGSDAVGGLAGWFKSAGSSEGGLLSSIGSLFRANGGPVSKGNTYRVNELGEEFFTPGSDGYITPAGRGGAAGGAPGVTIIDQRTTAAPAPEVRSGPGGSREIVLRDAESALAARGRRGQGPYAPAFNTPGSRIG